MSKGGMLAAFMAQAFLDEGKGIVEMLMGAPGDLTGLRMVEGSECEHASEAGSVVPDTWDSPAPTLTSHNLHMSARAGALQEQGQLRGHIGESEGGSGLLRTSSRGDILREQDPERKSES
ncbi:hypothetical protein JB92DRAFT_2836520 [Gautieria morchelliformis]|nr:hypothetical protein JB92DRAFT_2836520 [Gautieria morchelliformis]